MTDLYNEKVDWVPYLTRPFSLFGASLWQAWYDSKQIQDSLGVFTPDALFIEEHHNVVRYYKEKHQLEQLRAVIKETIKDDPELLNKFYEQGFKFNRQADTYLKEGANAFSSFDDIIHFVISLALYATVIPNMSLGFFDELNVANKELHKNAESLRGTSYYPRFFSEMVTPHVLRILQNNALNTLDAAELVTLTELRQGNFEAVKERLEARQANKHFVYQLLNGVESVHWVSDIKSLISSLEGFDDVIKSGLSEIRGRTAYPGQARGVARLVLSDDGRNVVFNEGDILVSINSNPTLMPLILKSAAIVTDEGGIATHAAIVSRELKKPCVMGTKYATALIKDGDTIEVDADKGIVRIVQ